MMKNNKSVILIVLGVIVAIFAVLTCQVLLGTTRKAKAVDTMIESIGEVTLDSADKIVEAEEALDGLDTELQEKVNNKSLLELKRKEFDNLAVNESSSLLSKATDALRAYEVEASMEYLKSAKALMAQVTSTATAKNGTEYTPEKMIETIDSLIEETKTTCCIRNSEILLPAYVVSSANQVGETEEDGVIKYTCTFSGKREFNDAVKKYTDYLQTKGSVTGNVNDEMIFTNDEIGSAKIISYHISDIYFLQVLYEEKQL